MAYLVYKGEYWRRVKVNGNLIKGYFGIFGIDHWPFPRDFYALKDIIRNDSSRKIFNVISELEEIENQNGRMGPPGFEPGTFRLSAGRSTKLSYGPLNISSKKYLKKLP